MGKIRVKKNNNGKKKKDPWLESFQAGYGMVEENLIFSPLLRYVYVDTEASVLTSTGNSALMLSNGNLYVNRKHQLQPEEWAYVLAHCLLHLGLWHFEERDDIVRWNIACDLFVTKFLKDSKLFRPPSFIREEFPFPPESEDKNYQRLLLEEDLESFKGFSCGETLTDFQIKEVNYWSQKDEPKKFYTKLFERALGNAAYAAVGVAAGYLDNIKDQGAAAVTTAEKARRWCISSFPLLGALAAGFQLIEDPLICQREEISVAAVSESIQIIYINPGAGLTEAECRFVMAHELLHVGLRHQSRCQGRDPYLWNVACDYVINGWLLEMGIGHLPKLDSLYDPEFSGMSAEEIYDLIAKDLRRFRKLSTLRGKGLSDIIGEKEVRFYKAPVDLDEFYRRSITEGLEYHQAKRGLLPAGLAEEIRALYRPPIPWDVELARWFDQFFPPVEKRRSYSRPSRRQSATPDLIRPRTIFSEEDLEGRTFGVVIDTSGSMNRYMLAVALGSAASYAESRDVPLVRVVFCDAAAYDAGYLAPEAIMDRIKVRGRGGTVLQPGIDLLEKTRDFPEKGPLLIVTDGECDHFRCRRDHAVLIPKGSRLPFRSTGQIFYFE